MLGLKLNHVSKMGHMKIQQQVRFGEVFHLRHHATDEMPPKISLVARPKETFIF